MQDVVLNLSFTAGSLHGLLRPCRSLHCLLGKGSNVLQYPLHNGFHFRNTRPLLQNTIHWPSQCVAATAVPCQGSRYNTHTRTGISCRTQYIGPPSVWLQLLSLAKAADTTHTRTGISSLHEDGPRPTFGMQI